MSSSPARRKTAEKMNTPKNIEIWNKQFLEQDPDSPIHGDIIQLTKGWNQFPKGTLGLVEIGMDSRINSPVRSVTFCDGWGVCGLNQMKYKIIGKLVRH